MAADIAIVLGLTACAAAAVSDLRTRRVPNWLTFSTIALAIAIAAFGGVASLAVALAVAAGAILVGTAMHAAGLLGGGDVKLLIGICVLAGFPDCIALLLYTALAGGVLAVAYSAARGRLSVVLGRTATALCTGMVTRRFVPAGDGDHIPYAIAIACGFAALALANTLLPELKVPL